MATKMSTERNVIPIVFSFDRHMEMAAGVCITSLLKNAGEKTFYDIFILHSPDNDFSGSRINDLPSEFSNCRITFRCVGRHFDGAYQVRGITEAAYYRILIPLLIPEYDKVLYSDVDVIFCTDLLRYYELDINGYYYGAVDAFPCLPKDTRRYIASSLRIDGSKGYFYDGNLIVNSQLLRSDNMVQKIMDKAMSGKFLFQEMDVINIVCHGRIKPLEVSFCLTTYIYDSIVKEGQNTGNVPVTDCIVHYNGVKPWQSPCPNMDIWWSYYRNSIFFDERFAHDFWTGQRDIMQRMPLCKRIKQLLRYPLDRKQW